jgi:hypothetical protein
MPTQPPTKRLIQAHRLLTIVDHLHAFKIARILGVGLVLLMFTEK